MEEREEELKSLLKVRREKKRKSWLKTPHSKNEDHWHLVPSLHEDRWENDGN